VATSARSVLVSRPVRTWSWEGTCNTLKRIWLRAALVDRWVVVAVFVQINDVRLSDRRRLQATRREPTGLHDQRASLQGWVPDAGVGNASNCISGVSSRLHKILCDSGLLRSARQPRVLGPRGRTPGQPGLHGRRAGSGRRGRAAPEEPGRKLLRVLRDPACSPDSRGRRGTLRGAAAAVGAVQQARAMRDLAAAKMGAHSASSFEGLSWK